MENQTRELLKWLVEKLPRSEEEGAQEVLGANALMNRRIMQSLKEWKHKSWKLHFCSKGKVLRNVYDTKQFRTIPGLLENEKGMQTLQIFQRASVHRLPVECSLFERHALEHVADAKYAQRLEQDFADGEGVEGDGGEDELGGAGEGKRGDKKGANSLTQQAIRAALLKAVNGGGTGAGAGGAAGGPGSGPVMMVDPANTAMAKGLAGSFQDLLRDITDEHRAGESLLIILHVCVCVDACGRVCVEAIQVVNKKFW